MISRREFLMTSGVMVATTAFQEIPLFSQGQLTTSFEDLRRNVGIFNGQGGTIGWIVNGDGILIVDSQNAAAAQAAAVARALRCAAALAAAMSVTVFEGVRMIWHGPAGFRAARRRRRWRPRSVPLDAWAHPATRCNASLPLPRRLPTLRIPFPGLLAAR